MMSDIPYEEMPRKIEELAARIEELEEIINLLEEYMKSDDGYDVENILNYLKELKEGRIYG